MTRPRTNRVDVAAAGCRCAVCKGRADDPEGIHRHRGRLVPASFQIQRRLPISLGLLGAVCEEACFTEHDGTPCVEALVRLGNGMVKGPYTLVLSFEQALEADIIERV